MKVNIKLFASFREVAGTSDISVEVLPGTTVGQLWHALTQDYPRLEPFTGISAFAVNGCYERKDTTLTDGDVVAFIPPVSGG